MTVHITLTLPTTRGRFQIESANSRDRLCIRERIGPPRIGQAVHVAIFSDERLTVVEGADADGTPVVHARIEGPLTSPKTEPGK